MGVGDYMGNLPEELLGAGRQPFDVDQGVVPDWPAVGVVQVDDRGVGVLLAELLVRR